MASHYGVFSLQLPRGWKASNEEQSSNLSRSTGNDDGHQFQECQKVDGGWWGSKELPIYCMPQRFVMCFPVRHSNGQKFGGTSFFSLFIFFLSRRKKRRSRASRNENYGCQLVFLWQRILMRLIFTSFYQNIDV